MRRQLRSFTAWGMEAHLLGLVAAVALLLSARPAMAEPVVWVAPSLERVGATAAPGTAAQMTLYAARGEYESFQIVVRAPAGGLTNVNVTAPDLVGPGGQTIAKSSLTLYREYYVYVPYSSPDPGSGNRPLGPGWYPDGLIPFVDPATGQDLTGATLDAVPFSVAADRNRPIWVDVFVPRDAAPGEYAGVFTVTSDQGQAQVTLRLNVWRFTLPVKPALKSAFLYWNVRGQLQPDQELLRHRIMPYSVDPANEVKFIADYGLNATSLGFWARADKDTGTMDPPPTSSELNAAIARHQPGLWLFNYTVDEIAGITALFPGVRSWARALHEVGVDQLITMPPTTALFDDGSGTGRSAVDVWVELPKQYNADLVGEALAKGDEVWSYNCLTQDSYSPKWEIDFAPINYRIQPGFINQSLGMSGLLYWRADLWTSDPWDDVMGYSDSYPGEGMLVYPGAQVGLPGVVGSMRLKWLRDGGDDYDYVELLKEAGSGEWALEVTRSVGPDWRNWTRDPGELEAARKRLGDVLGSDFRDVPPDHWAYASIYACRDAGIVNGYPSDQTYRPDYEVTRDQMAVFVSRALAGGEAGVPPGPPEATFPDVPTDHWAYKYIEYIAASNVSNGYPEGYYRPTLAVDRGQMAVFVARSVVSPLGEEGLAGYTPPTTPTFPDVPTDHWAYKHVEYIASRGISEGYDNGTYRPSATCTRDQMAVFVARAFALPE